MIDTFSYNGKVLKADPPVEVVCFGHAKNKKYYRAAIPSIHVVVVEKTEHVAILNLNRKLVCKWNEYAFTDNDELDENGTGIKRNLLAFLKDVTP